MSKKLTTEEFIERARAVHGDTYILDKVNYVDSSTKVEIVCPKHGSFWIAPFSFLSGIGCKKCGYERNSANRAKTTEQFIKDARKVHGDKYDYSKVEYVNSHTKVCIICHEKDENGIEHGEFWQIPKDHIKGCKCKKCQHLHKYSTEEFITKAHEVHGDKYDYSKVEYINSHTKVCIICPIHGEFWQTPNGHLQGSGCFKCKYELMAEQLSSKNFIEKAKIVHGDKYDYSKVEYTNNKTKVCIICPKHGEFWQTPNGHLQGVGCPKCSDSKLEKKVSRFLIGDSIESIYEKHFNWLGLQSLDFYLPKYNIAIECQGEQHFVGWHRKKKSLEYIQQLDSKKKKLCEEHGVKLYYINYNDEVETKLKEILRENGIDKDL